MEFEDFFNDQDMRYQDCGERRNAFTKSRGNAGALLMRIKTDMHERVRTLVMH